MYLTGMVDKRTLEKYEREAKEKNRETWYLSWCMDTNQEGEYDKMGSRYSEILFTLAGVFLIHFTIPDNETLSLVTENLSYNRSCVYQRALVMLASLLVKLLFTTKPLAWASLSGIFRIQFKTPDRKCPDNESQN
jgi:hypothetical protein